MKAELKFIGEISTPYKMISDCPNNIQPNGPLCRITLYDGYHEGLSGLQSGQEILIMYWLDGTDRDVIRQKCKKGNSVKGTFALRSPHRPNPIGVAVLPIDKLENGQVVVKGLDCLNGTKLLDIKPAIYHEIAAAD